MELILIAGAVAFYLTSLFFGWRSFQKNCENAGTLGSRLEFAVRILRTNQIWILCLWLVALFFVAVIILFGDEGAFVYGYVFMVWSVFGIVGDIALAVLTFVVSLLVYRFAVKSMVENSNIPFSAPSVVPTEPKNSWKKDFKVMGSVLAVIIVTLLVIWPDLRRQLINPVIENTGAVSLVKYRPYYQQIELYSHLAERKQDITICDNIMEPNNKFECYRIADPEYPKYQETCALYEKAGENDSADYYQRNCILDKLNHKATVSEADCGAIAKTYANNIAIDQIMSGCADLIVR